ncbi:MAG: hypothetical protein JSV75_01100 [Candidatus Bathyarchaeota archaeon]|nr:MAG: hypothetical protein JSV75_01100 [Candidatus Bathyarchaeota archaeon]
MSPKISTSRVERCLMAGREELKKESLEKEGWIRQTTIGEPRLSEIIELYKSLGYEVSLESVNPDDLDEECRRCYEKEINEVKTVYVRKKK